MGHGCIRTFEIETPGISIRRSSGGRKLRKRRERILRRVTEVEPAEEGKASGYFTIRIKQYADIDLFVGVQFRVIFQDRAEKVFVTSCHHWPHVSV